MRTPFIIGLLLFVLHPPPVAAQHAGAFARMGFGARGMALGNAIAADVTGQASPYYNPALAPFLARQSLDFSSALMTLDRQLQFVQLSTPLRPRAGIAGGLIHAGVENFDGRDASGYHTGTFAISEYAFFMAFGVSVSRRLTAGVGLELFRSDYHTDVPTARSLGIDLGLSFRINDRLHVGTVVDDLLASYAWDTAQLHRGGGKTTDHFPRRVRLGAAYQWSSLHLFAEYESRFTVSQVWHRRVELVGGALREVIYSEDLRLHESRYRAGAEYRFVPALAIRGGTSSVGHGAMRPSAGFMVEQPVGKVAVRAEYAFLLEPYALGTMHLLTLCFLL